MPYLSTLMGWVFCAGRRGRGVGRGGGKGGIRSRTGAGPAADLKSGTCRSSDATTR